MARVKVCPNCSHRNLPGDFFCNCDYPLADVSMTDEEPVVEAAPGPEEGADDDAAPHEAAPLNSVMDEARRATLVFGWGEVVVTSGECVGIGRDPDFSQHAPKLADNDWVSLRHAEVFMKEGGSTYVRSLSETNPTYVNGESHGKGDEVQLHDRDLVGFSKHLPARVRFG